MLETPVLIAGGGPIGLTLGLTLATRGVKLVLAERNPETTRFPKMDLTNSRSMELFSRLGMSGAVRQAGVPQDHNFDVAWITAMTGHELHRFRYPSPTEMWQRIAERNDGSMPAEPAMRISQVVLEPLFKTKLQSLPSAMVKSGWAVEDFTQDAAGVTSKLRNAATGATETIRSQYLIGCDGANSRIRAVLGIPLEGQQGARQSFQVHFRSRRYDVLQRFGVAWHYQSGGGGTLICQDDDQYWTLQGRVPLGADTSGIDPRALLTKFLGTDIDPEIVLANPWTGNLLVAERYRQGRVFLAGDSAHQVIPTGGYGMNTGVGEAFDLGWKLAAVLQDWGGPKLLDSYETERLPVARRNRDASGESMHVRAQVAQLYAAAGDLELPDVRAKLATELAAIGNTENERWGIEYGYIYTDSPILAGDPEPPPAFDPLRYQPTTVPGARLPSIVLADGRSLYECLGRDFTLLVFPGADHGSAATQAAALGMPLTILPLQAADWRPVYGRRMILVRPDHHVAWRGDEPPHDWATILRRASGH